jgi:hypothetical protein
MKDSCCVLYGRAVKECKTTQTWERTRLSNLVRHHRTGGYYARAYANGKEVWRSLKTKHFSVAEAKLAEFLRDHRKSREAQGQASSAKITFGAASELYRQRLADNVNIKRRTRDYYAEILAALERNWPALADIEVRKVTPA